MPNLPYDVRLERLDTEIAALRRLLDTGAAPVGVLGRYRLLSKRRSWYVTRTGRRQPGGPRFYALRQHVRARRPEVPTDLVLDIRTL